MKTFLILFAGMILLSSSAFALDLGFRYQDGKCVNPKGEQGLNPSHLGPCADFRNVVLGRIDLSFFDFSGSRFDGADLQAVSFAKAKLMGTSFQSAVLTGVDFSEAELRGTKFISAKISNLKIDETIFDGVDFSKATIGDSDMVYFKCVGCNFTQAKIQKNNWSNGELIKCNFMETDLNTVEMSKTLIQGTSFEKASLLGNFRGAKIVDSSFLGAKLKASDFSEARFEQVILKGAIFSQRTKLPFSVDEAKKQGMVYRALNLKVFVWSAFADRNTGENGEYKNSTEVVQQGEMKYELDPYEGVDVATFVMKMKRAEVLLIPEMEAGTNDAFMTSVGPAVRDYVNEGGLVVVLAGYRNFFQNTMLMPKANCGNGTYGAGARIKIPAKHFLLEGLTSETALAANATFYCNISTDPDIKMLVGDGLDRASFFYKKIGKGAAAYLGYDFYEHNADADRLLRNIVGAITDDL